MTSPPAIADWSERIRSAASDNRPIRLRGGGTKDFYGQQLVGEVLDTRGYAGIVEYEPTELVVTARCGTALSEVEAALHDAGQMLAFEPPHFGVPAATISLGVPGNATSGSTLGGCIAAGLSGPRRAYSGAVRDLVLGVRVLDGRGNDLRFGGQVMKNVAGFDVSRLMVGAMGTLGVILEVSLKCLPSPKAETTRQYALSEHDAITRINQWSGKPWPISASCWHNGILTVRFSGAPDAVSAATLALGGEVLMDGEAWWASVRDQQHPFFHSGIQDVSLWRISVRSSAPSSSFGGHQLIEWSGAIRWIVNPSESAAQMRAWAHAYGGHATLFRGSDKECGVFQPLDAPLEAIHLKLKRTFDPAGILNPQRMYSGF